MVFPPVEICIYLGTNKSVEVGHLETALYDAVAESVSGIHKVSVAFSGGVDSSIIAKICHNLGKQVTLITIGFPGSHDI